MKQASAMRHKAIDQATDERSLQALLDRLRRISDDELRSTWVSAAMSLPARDALQVAKEVSRMTGLGVSALNAELKLARAAASASAERQAFDERAGNRQVIVLQAENLTRQAQQAEAAIVAAAPSGTYVSFSGALCQVTTKPLPYTHFADEANGDPPAVPQIAPLDEVAMLARLEDVVVFCDQGKQGRRPIGVPRSIIEILLKKQEHAAPRVTGLVTHPVVLPRDGSILAVDGLHSDTGLFLSGACLHDARPYTQSEASEAIDRLRDAFLEGFEFASPMDADIALAGLFTGVQRRVLDIAPGVAAMASTQSSGKTTWARRLHVVLTGQDIPVSTFPQGDEAEVQKRLLSTLMRSPAMICFDNITDGTTFRSGAVAAAMTGPVLSQRVLGLSRDADCPTNVMFVITGNNLSLGADEVTRWLVARLAPAAARPEQRQFKHPNVVAHALAMRLSARSNSIK